MFPFSRPLMETLEAFSKKEGTKCPGCTKCGEASVWMDWGPIVGKGYYCKTCKVDVEHDENVYGSLASAKRKITMSTRPLSTDDEYEYIPINCTKPNCSNCAGQAHYPQHIPIAINNFIKCINNFGVTKSLQLNARYKVTSVAPGSVTVQVGSMHKEYSRCRFHLEVKKVKTA